jgi:hypothetical protein
MLSYLRAWTPPGQTEFEYSNLGFALLGLALERAAERPLASLMASEILQPAAASGAGLEPDLAVGQVQGHDASGRPTAAWNMGAFAGAGALRANLAQMLALLEAARLGRAPFDAGAQREQARLHATGSVGLGWMRTEKHGDRIVWHNGGTGGFRSFVGYSEVSGRAVVLMANGVIDLDALGMHLINPAFRPQPPDAPLESAAGWFVWAAALIALASLAWRALRPRSLFEATLELSLVAAMLALVWRKAPDTDPLTTAAVLGLTLLAAGLMLWRGRKQPTSPSRRRATPLAGLNVAVGACLVLCCGEPPSGPKRIATEGLTLPRAASGTEAARPRRRPPRQAVRTGRRGTRRSTRRTARPTGSCLRPGIASTSGPGDRTGSPRRPRARPGLLQVRCTASAPAARCATRRLPDGRGSRCRVSSPASLDLGQRRQRRPPERRKSDGLARDCARDWVASGYLQPRANA